MPYLYTLAEEASRTGLPIMRPLFLEFPHATKDGHPLDLDAGSEFLFGPSLLVAPPPFPGALETYHLFLPPGGWYNYWTGQKVDESESPPTPAHPGTPLTLRPTTDVLPVYVRAGTILPRQPLVQSTMETPVGPLELWVYPGPQGQGSLYLDDGGSMAYRHGEFLRQDYSSSAEGGRDPPASRRPPGELRSLVETDRGRDLRMALGRRFDHAGRSAADGHFLRSHQPIPAHPRFG